ncbi:hypothetical protein ACFLY4_09295 [Chloroflexota bacterium]
MTIKSEMNEKYDPKSQPESFSKPRTIPSKWDVSAFQSQITASQTNELEQQSEVPDPVETEQPDPEWEPDPFPKPRTIPGNWDTSSLV